MGLKEREKVRINTLGPGVLTTHGPFPALHLPRLFLSECRIREIMPFTKLERRALQRSASKPKRDVERHPDQLRQKARRGKREARKKPAEHLVIAYRPGTLSNKQPGTSRLSTALYYYFAWFLGF